MTLTTVAYSATPIRVPKRYHCRATQIPPVSRHPRQWRMLLQRVKRCWRNSSFSRRNARFLRSNFCGLSLGARSPESLWGGVLREHAGSRALQWPVSYRSFLSTSCSTHAGSLVHAFLAAWLIIDRLFYKLSNSEKLLLARPIPDSVETRWLVWCGPFLRRVYRHLGTVLRGSWQMNDAMRFFGQFFPDKPAASRAFVRWT